MYESTMVNTYAELMRGKLGLQESHDGDDRLTTNLLSLMQANQVDYTNFFRTLGDFHQDDPEANTPIRDMFIDREGFDRWALKYQDRLLAEHSQDADRRTRMNQCNPKYILRNYLVQIAIQLANDEHDYSEIDCLLQLLRDPFAEQPEMEAYAGLPPDWAKRISVSCSS